MTPDPPPNAVKVSTTDVLASVGANDKKQRGKKSTKKNGKPTETYLDVPDRKLGSILDQWVISPTYKWSILGL